MTTATKIKRGTFQHVEAELYAYHETKREITRIKNDILYGTSPLDENVGGGRSNIPSDPTGRAGTLLASYRLLQHMVKVIDAIEEVYNQLPEEKKKLIQLKYWTKYQELSWEGIAMQLHVSRNTAINWRNEIVKTIAENLGWC